MKKFFFLLLSVIYLSASAQNPVPVGSTNSWVYIQGVGDFTNVWNAKLLDTTASKLIYPLKTVNRWARENGRLYFNPTGTKFILVDDVPAIDTSSLSSRIDQRVKYTDTAAMLINYVLKSKVLADSTALASAINSRVKYTDTSAMLSPYATKANLTDTAALLRSLITTAGIDTTNLSNRINERVKYTDTAAMLSNLYAIAASMVKYADTAAMLGNLYTIAASKVKYSDTAAMLANYYRTATATAALALKANLASPTFTGTVTTPALTISGLTAGSASDSVVTVNASTGVLYRRAFPSSGGGSAWGLPGNAGTTAGTNFLGTTDAQDFHIRAGNNLKVIVPKNYAIAQPGLGFYDGASLVVNVGASSAVGYGLVIGADFNGAVYLQSQSLGAPTAFPMHMQAKGGIVGIGTSTPNNSALLDLTSTTRGFLPPRMTSAQVAAISSPATGLQVYDTDIKRIKTYDGSAWRYSPNVYTGTAAPATTPLAVGDTFIDTSGAKMYVATGTASSADWTIVN